MHESSNGEQPTEAERNPWTHPKWVAAILSAAAALFAVLGPITTCTNSESQIRLQRSENRAKFVLEVLQSESPIEDKIALLRFLKLEYEDAPIHEWSDSQVLRLNDELQRRLAIQEEARQRATSEDEQKELAEDVLALQSQLAETRSLLPGENQEQPCLSIVFTVFKPFGADKTQESYSEPIRKAVHEACVAQRPSPGVTEWSIWVTTEEDTIPKRTTCRCQ